MNFSTKRSTTTFPLFLVLSPIVTGSLFAVSSPDRADFVERMIDGVIDNAGDIYDYSVGGMV